MLFPSVQMEYYGSVYVFVLGALFLLVNHNAFATDTADHCQGMNFQIADENRCEDFYTCINQTWISKSCKYPELFSNITNKCEAFEKVDCGSRFVPVSPCDYSRTSCIRRSDGQCHCKQQSDIDFNMCLNLSDGYYTWPERKWSPYYVKCQDGRTFPSQCLGASVIYDFVHHNCDLIYAVLNYAYNLSMYFHLPASSLSYLDSKSTEDRRQTTIQKISNYTQKPPLIIPSTTYDDLILKTLSIFDTFCQIQTVYTSEPEISRYTDNGQSLPSTLENVISAVESKLSTRIPYFFEQSSLLWSSYETRESYSKNLQQSKTSVNLMTLRETLNKSQIESFSPKHGSVQTLLPYILSGSFMSSKTVKPDFTDFFVTSDMSEQTIQPNFPTVLATSFISGHSVQPSFKAVTESSHMSEQTLLQRSSAVISTSDMSVHIIQPSLSAVTASSQMPYLTVQPSNSAKTATRDTPEQTEQPTFPAVIASSDLTEQTVQLFPPVIPKSDISEQSVHPSFPVITATSSVSEQTFRPNFPVVIATNNISERIVQPSLPAVDASSNLSEQSVQRSFLVVTATTYIPEQTVQHSFPAVTVTIGISKQIVQPSDSVVIATSHIAEQSVQPSDRAITATSDKSEQTVQPSVTAVTVTNDKAEQTVQPRLPAVNTTSEISEQTFRPRFPTVTATSHMPEQSVRPCLPAITVTSDISEQSVQPSVTAVTTTSDIAEETVQLSFLDVITTSDMSEQTFQPSFPAVTATSHMSNQVVQHSFPVKTETRHISEQTVQPSFTAVTATSHMSNQTVQPSFPIKTETRHISEQTVQPSFTAVTATSHMSNQTVQPSFTVKTETCHISAQTVQPSFTAVSATSYISDQTIQPSVLSVIATSDMSDQTVRLNYTSLIKSEQTAEKSFITLSAANHMSEQTIEPSITAITSTRNVSKPTEIPSLPAVTAKHHSESVEIQSYNNSVGTANSESIIAALPLTDKTLTLSIENVRRETDYSNILPTATSVYIKSESDIAGELPSDIFGHFSKGILKGPGYKTDSLVTHTSQLLNPNSYFMSNSLEPSFAIKSSASFQLISRQFESSFDITLVSELTEVNSGPVSLTEIYSSFFPQQIPDSSTHFESSFSTSRSKDVPVSISSADSSTTAFSERHKFSSKGNEHTRFTVQSFKNEPLPVQTETSTMAMTNIGTRHFSSKLSKIDSDNLPTVSAVISYTSSKGHTESVSFAGINVYKEQSGKTIVPYSVSKASTKLVSLVESTSVKYSHSSTSSPSLSDKTTDKTTLIVSFSVTVGGIIVLAILTALIMCFCKANRQGGASLTEDVDSRLYTIR